MLFSKIGRLNRVGIKVGLGIGLLLSRFAIAALVSPFQARIVDEKVREITEATSAAAYEMEINLIGSGMGVLQYLQTGDYIYRQRVLKDEADLERFEAQYHLLAETPDLVLMDLGLPVLTGWEAARRLKAAPETGSIPILAVTAHAMSDDRCKALEAGCDDYDSKPIGFSRLLGKIELLLGNGGQS